MNTNTDNQVKYIVGDGFEGFSKHDQVYTVSQIKCIAKELGSTALKNELFVVGQGVNNEEIKEIKALDREQKLGLVVNSNQKRACNGSTHKHVDKNIMISEPQEVGGDYICDLMVDDGCAEMSDHATGEHIQGMVLVEAARQMMLSVAEKYLIEDEWKNKLYCVLCDMSSNFINFAFPIDITLVHKIIKHENAKPGNHAVASVTEFYQNRELIASIEISYALNKKKVLAKRENMVAQKVLNVNSKQWVSDTSLDEIA